MVTLGAPQGYPVCPSAALPKGYHLLQVCVVPASPIRIPESTYGDSNCVQAIDPSPRSSVISFNIFFSCECMCLNLVLNPIRLNGLYELMSASYSQKNTVIFPKQKVYFSKIHLLENIFLATTSLLLFQALQSL